MKRIRSALCVLLSLIWLLTACNTHTSSAPSVETTRADTDTAPLFSMTVRPPTRSANEQYPASAYGCSFSLKELWERADAVALVSIGNWLSESDYGSYYDAIVVKCYKGNLPASIVIEQAGSSVKSYTDFPLFTYGNEFFVFLQNWDAEAFSARGPYSVTIQPPWFVEPDTNDGYYTESPEVNDGVMPITDDEVGVEVPDWGLEPIITYPVLTNPPFDSNDTPDPEPEPEPAASYENCYQILGSSALMDAAVGLDGNVYLLDRYYLVEPSLGLTAPINRPSDEIAEDILQVLSTRDSYSYRLFSGRILYRLSDLLEYWANPNLDAE